MTVEKKPSPLERLKDWFLSAGAGKKITAGTPKRDSKKARRKSPIVTDEQHHARLMAKLDGKALTDRSFTRRGRPR